MKVQAIIPAAGSGTRLKSSVAKPLIKIKGVPIVVHTLKVFERSASVESVVLVVSKALLNQFKKIVATYRLKKVKKIIVGGKTRQASVYQGLLALDKDTQLAVVHDAARPCLEKSDLEKAIQACKGVEGGVTVAVPVKCTIKSVHSKSLTVEKTLERQKLWEIQTPQVFKASLLLKAHQKYARSEATDDAALIERLGKRIKIVQGSYKNIKITTSEDMDLAQKYLSKT